MPRTGCILLPASFLSASRMPFGFLPPEAVIRVLITQSDYSVLSRSIKTAENKHPKHMDMHFGAVAFIIDHWIGKCAGLLGVMNKETLLKLQNISSENMEERIDILATYITRKLLYNRLESTLAKNMQVAFEVICRFIAFLQEDTRYRLSKAVNSSKNTPGGDTGVNSRRRRLSHSASEIPKRPSHSEEALSSSYATYNRPLTPTLTERHMQIRWSLGNSETWGSLHNALLSLYGASLYLSNGKNIDFTIQEALILSVGRRARLTNGMTSYVFFGSYQVLTDKQRSSSIVVLLMRQRVLETLLNSLLFDLLMQLCLKLSLTTLNNFWSTFWNNELCTINQNTLCLSDCCRSLVSFIFCINGNTQTPAEKFLWSKQSLLLESLEILSALEKIRNNDWSCFKSLWHLSDAVRLMSNLQEMLLGDTVTASLRGYLSFINLLAMEFSNDMHIFKDFREEQ